MEQVYLKQNVLVEPLINQWYAWSGLIAPATAAMYIAHSHMKIMQSFVATPQVHIQALKNPLMRGGPFINYDANKVPAVKSLIEKTRNEQAHMLKLASAIQQTSENLLNEAAGFSLEPRYEQVPDALKGYVELVYDLSNNPSVRFIEGLLYKSPYYNPSSQSIALSLVEQDERPFALSTPVMEQPGKIILPIRFDSAALDHLFDMKYRPQPLDYIKGILGIDGKNEDLFSSFFTTEPPAPAPVYDLDEVRIRYFGHACVLVQTKDISVLTDPVISYQHSNGINRFTYADLPETIDYVLITHNHQDHCVLETLLQIRRRIKNLLVPKNNGGWLADPSMKFVLQNLGFERVREIDEMESIEIAGGSITGLPFLGEHADLNIRTKLAYLVKVQNQSVLFAADSNNIEPRLYEHIRTLLGDVNVVFIGMECDGGPLSWLYGPLLTKPLARKQDQSRRLDGSDFEKALDIVNRLNAQHVYVYAMGQEPWLAFLTSIQYTEQSRPIIESQKLVDECKRRGLQSERLYGQKEIIINGKETHEYGRDRRHAAI